MPVAYRKCNNLIAYHVIQNDVKAFREVCGEQEKTNATLQFRLNNVSCVFIELP